MAVNLHTHSLFSVDGWQTPEALAEQQASKGATVLSLTDHNTTDGLPRCRRQAERLGMRFINGMEADAFWQGESLHFLALGFELPHAGLEAFCRSQCEQYTANYDRIHPLLESRYGVSRATLIAGLATRYPTHRFPMLNQWFVLDHMENSERFADRNSARAAMNKLIAEAERGMAKPFDWASFHTVRDVVHAAGGILLLAHVASYRPGDWSGQSSLIESLLDAGLDGFELYHPANTREPHFQTMVSAARQWGCAVSGGTDDHGDSEYRRASDPVVAPEWLVETLDNALANQRAFTRPSSPRPQPACDR